jgi:hypothetical protein
MVQFGHILTNPLWEVVQLVWNGEIVPNFGLELSNNSFQVKGNLLKTTAHCESNGAGQFNFDGSIMAYNQKAQQHVVMGVYFLSDEEVGGIRQRSILICYFRPTIWRHALFLFQEYFKN